MTIEDIKLILKAFYKVNDIERKVHGEQGAYEYSQTMEYYDDILMHYYDLKDKSSLPLSLDEAAKKHASSVEGDYAFSEGPDHYCSGDLEDAFKAGAQWRDAQIPKLQDNLDEVKLDISNMTDCGYKAIAEYYFNLGKKAGAEWMAGQFQKIEGELVDWYETKGVDYCCGVKTIDAFEVPGGFYIRKKQ